MEACNIDRFDENGRLDKCLSFYVLQWFWEEPDPSASACAILASEWTLKLEDKAVHGRMKQQEMGLKLWQAFYILCFE